ncbi:MAG: acyl-CoA dehydratase activase [Spirochaetaceae bacterium]|nr:acyl-CoA dehydratase activase [Spirochaetaceae bacterium]
MKHFLGLDIGSTTAKAVLLNRQGEQVFSKYVRHNTQIFATLIEILTDIKNQFGNIKLSAAITGTAGMGVAERAAIHFEQEVVAAGVVAEQRYRDCRTLIDIGGEDAKIIFFNADMKADIRMNGACAGGTGAFIDQMATLLGYKVEELNDLAKTSATTYPIASRCGVFAKTDVQNLIARGIPAGDIASSIFRAVAFQTINALTRGFDVRPKIIFAGGPLTFMSELRKAFYDILKINESAVIDMPHTELIPALGAALSTNNLPEEELDNLINRITATKDVAIELSARLEPLFKNNKKFEEWLTKKNSQDVVAKAEPLHVKNHQYFLGIDSGSTTTKIVLINKDGAVVARNYSPNNGNPIDAVHRGLSAVRDELATLGVTNPTILRSATTGYGEELTHFAFKFDDSLVETIAHYRAASHFNPNVSFILDIGGQDMKAIFINDGIINNLELNESCSSGSGSFIETFAKNLSLSVQDFALAACLAQNPGDLGTRCTVFMNSKVKQSLREGATQGDISAGLAYSVVKNCFNKVLKLTDMSLLGDNIVVQGGTFKNPAVLRALEKIVGHEVTRPDICELMGAYGAALTALERYKDGEKSTFIGFTHLDQAKNNTRRSLQCSGCENLCQITQISFEGESRKFYSGNKCEKNFTNHLNSDEIGFNMHDYKRELLFNRPNEAVSTKKGRIGIPRVLNMWEDYPYWHTLFTHCGFDVVLSSPSTVALAEKGYGGVMSENICFPAKIAGGHIIELCEAKVDRIFYPMVFFGKTEYEDALNQYNCPVVTGYPEVIASAINPQAKYGIPFDKPPMAFNTPKLQYDSAKAYFVDILKVPEAAFKKAYKAALKSKADYNETLQLKAAEVIAKARSGNSLVIMLLGRPYHVDSLVNHKLPEMISALGVHVLTEDCLPLDERPGLDEVEVLTQWGYPNRIYEATLWAAQQANVQVVQMNSFGCGPDAVVVDEVKTLLNSYGKNPTLIKIDEITSPGSVKLRIRSMIESLKMRDVGFSGKKTERISPKIFELDDKIRTIIAPEFNPFYTSFIVEPFRKAGYQLEILPMPDRASIDVGLAYANNDICYPATIVIGDLIKALQSGNYDTAKTAVALTQTGGQCRASSYVSMLKKALVNAGFAEVPIVTITTHVDAKGGMHEQPGFIFKRTDFMLNCLLGILYGDILAKLYWATASREVVKGGALKVANKYIELGRKSVDYKHSGHIFKLAAEAVAEFNKIECKTEAMPRVGIVGEIYVKFNEFSNNYTAQWLIEHGIEPELPPLINFFLSTIVESKYNASVHVEEHSFKGLLTLKLARVLTAGLVKKANKVIEGSKLTISPIHDIVHLGENAATAIDLMIQFGESWLLPGDIVTFIEDGINDVLCLQPFGCIANHIIAKGLEKKLKERFPKLNLLFIDMDAGSSEVNIANRLSFLARGAHQSLNS